MPERFTAEELVLIGNAVRVWRHGYDNQEAYGALLSISVIQKVESSIEQQLKDQSSNAIR